MKSKVRILKALADETRFKIVLFLLNNKKSVSEITLHVEKAQPTVSLQLKLLEMSNVVESSKEGRKVFYQVSDEKIKKIIEALK